MRKTLALVSLAALVLALAQRPDLAHAHAAFAASQPEPGQRLQATPGVVVLRFSEPINSRLSRASVTDPSGQRSEAGLRESRRFRSRSPRTRRASTRWTG